MSIDHQDNAAEKFWNNPDMVENLLPFLDPHSTLCLAQSKISCALDILQDKENPSNWRKLINFWLEGMIAHDKEYSKPLAWRATFEQKRGQMMALVAILKMMKDANSAMQDLLKVICEKSSKEDRDDNIQISCSSRGACFVSPLGFLLLEEVEVAFGSALHEIISVHVWEMDDLLLSALVARLSRRNRKMTQIDVITLISTSRNSVEALCTLIHNCETTNLYDVRVSGNIEAAGWAALAKALSLTSVYVNCLFASRELAMEGKREDLRTIWESLWEDDGAWIVDDNIIFDKSRGEEGWGALEQVLG